MVRIEGHYLVQYRQDSKNGYVGAGSQSATDQVSVSDVNSRVYNNRVCTKYIHKFHGNVTAQFKRCSVGNSGSWSIALSWRNRRAMRFRIAAIAFCCVVCNCYESCHVVFKTRSVF